MQTYTETWCVHSVIIPKVSFCMNVMCLYYSAIIYIKVNHTSSSFIHIDQHDRKNFALNVTIYIELVQWNKIYTQLKYWFWKTICLREAARTAGINLTLITFCTFTVGAECLSCFSLFPLFLDLFRGVHTEKTLQTSIVLLRC